MVCLQLQDGLGDDPLGSELSRLAAQCLLGAEDQLINGIAAFCEKPAPTAPNS